MSIFSGIKNQLRSVIQWENADPAELFRLWSENGDEIKNCSKLIVGPGQGVIFVYEGKVQAVHETEGLYELGTANIPFLTTLSRFMQAFVSEHKVGLYYFWRTEFVNQRWGTITPIKYADPVYKFPVGLRAFGNFSFKISDAPALFVNIIGARSVFTVEDAKKALISRFTQPLADVLAKSGFSYIDIDKNRNELAAALSAKVAPELGTLGFQMTDFRLENTDFDDDTVRRIGKIADTMAETQAAQAAGINYAAMQQLQALRDAAKNEGGAAGAGIGIGAGVGLGQMMAAGLAGTQGSSTAAAAVQSEDPSAALEKLFNLMQKGIISKEDFEAKKAELLQKIR